MGSDSVLIIAFVVAFGAAVFLAAAETSLLRISQVRVQTLAETAGARGRRLAGLEQRLTRVLNTILLAALLSQIVAATIVGVLAERWFGSIGVTVGSVVLTFILFVYAEAIPKTYAMRHADRVGLAVAIPVSGLELLLRPVVRVLIAFADLQAPGVGVSTSPTITEKELRLLADRAASEGQIEESDVELIERAFRFGDRTTEDVMVPRTEIVGVRADDDVASALHLAMEAGHRRLVVYGDSLDDVTGVVRFRDLAAVPADRQTLEVATLSIEPLLVPASKRIVDLLRDMQRAGIHLAVVVDEYGGTAGLVTVEDIAEELMGSIAEDAVDAEIVEIGDGTWSVAGLVPTEDLEEVLGVEFGQGEWNTVAGVVIDQLGQIPNVGDEVVVAGVQLRVIATRGRRILRIEASLSTTDSV
jgi:CBS domain containing-hemolysin-like protein